MSIRIAVEDTLEFPVKITLNDAGKLRGFSFSLVAKRKPAPDMVAFLQNMGSLSFGAGYEETCALLREVVTGWKGQTLVVDDETGAPAAFSRDGFELMLGLLGVASTMLLSYSGACSDKGREKN